MLRGCSRHEQIRIGYNPLLHPGRGYKDAALAAAVTAGPMEAAAAMTMLVPVFLPVAELFGIHPVHFGLVTVLGLLIGLVTPPVALCLFISGNIAGAPIERVFRSTVPLLLLQVGVLIIVTYFPQSYLWLPELFGFG